MSDDSERKYSDDESSEDDEISSEDERDSCKEELESDKWKDDKPLWRQLLDSYIDKERRKEDEENSNESQAELSKPPIDLYTSQEIHPPYECFPLNIFNDVKNQIQLPDKSYSEENVKIWEMMKTNPEIDIKGMMPDIIEEVKRTDSGKWPGTWPCIEQDIAGEMRQLKRLEKWKLKGLLPCQYYSDNELDDSEKPYDDYADHKELGHARVPAVCIDVWKTHLVDRASGENPGLVNGDYITWEFESVDEERVYAEVCLRGMKGMHLIEMSREREKTWKFCFYQALVALMVKTQLRYKYATSCNIDYIYDHAWMLFIHIGSLSITNKLHLDDVVVYNYKYDIELELIHELKDIPRISVTSDYYEPNLITIRQIRRPELMKVTGEIGWEKVRHPDESSVHEKTRKIEEWLEELPITCRNCIFRTSRFSLAFWNDGNFWYLYNPYRCDRFGVWEDNGAACIIKFCSRTTLKRHLMILLLRAYAYERPKLPIIDQSNTEKQDMHKVDEKNQQGNEVAKEEENKDVDESMKKEKDEGVDGVTKNNENKKVEDLMKEDEENEDAEEIMKRKENKEVNKEIEEMENEKETEEETPEKPNVFSIQIFQIIYHCVKIHNLKLLQRKPLKTPIKSCKNPKIHDLVKHIDLENEEQNPDILDVEQSSWLQSKITWSRCPMYNKGIKKDTTLKKSCWHQYNVEEKGKLFSMWGEIHPTGEMFAKENQGKQIHACYVVCAGMTRIMAPEYWSPKLLDTIVMCGDRYYTSSRLQSEVNSRNMVDVTDVANITQWSKASMLARYFKIGELLFEVDIKPAIHGKLYTIKDSLCKILQHTLSSYPFAILTCENSTLGVFKFCGSYYMLDVNSIGPPIFNYGHGVIYLLRATSFRRFLKTVLLTIGAIECSEFTVDPVDILKIVEIASTKNIKNQGMKKIIKKDN